MSRLAKGILAGVKRIWSIKMVRTGFSVSMSLLIFAFLIYYALKSLKELENVWRLARIDILLITFPLFVVMSVWVAYTWSKIIRHFGVNLPHDINIRIYLLTLAARRIPGSLLHVIGRVALYKRYGASAKVLSFASGLEILLVLWSGIIVTLCLWVFMNRVQVDQLWLLIVLLVIFTILLHPKTIRFLFVKLTRNEDVDSIKYSVLLGFLARYIVIWLGGGILLILKVNAIYPVDTPLWLPIMFAWSLSGVAGMLITFLPSGLGVMELTLSLVLGQIMPSSIAVSVALLSRILLTLYDFIISPFCLFQAE